MSTSSIYSLNLNPTVFSVLLILCSSDVSASSIAVWFIAIAFYIYLLFSYQHENSINNIVVTK